MKKQSEFREDPGPIGGDFIENEKIKNMKKSKVIFLGIIIVVIIALAVGVGFWVASMSSGGSSADAPSAYSAVYLSTGDVYFGKLSWFPSPHMTDVWYLQRSQDQSGNAQVALSAFKSIFWGPVDRIDFGAKDIVFSTRLKNGSQVVQTIEAQANGQNSVESSNGNLPSGAAQGANSPSTAGGSTSSSTGATAK